MIEDFNLHPNNGASPSVHQIRFMSTSGTFFRLVSVETSLTFNVEFDSFVSVDCLFDVSFLSIELLIVLFLVSTVSY